jgi:hypothetical protein
MAEVSELNIAQSVKRKSAVIAIPLPQLQTKKNYFNDAGLGLSAD